jgi:hypothetical protein
MTTGKNPPPKHLSVKPENLPPPPPRPSLNNVTNKYSIVFGKDIKPGDIIILNSNRIKIGFVEQGRGASSIDFGEYINIEYKILNCNTKDSAWVYPNCPYVKVLE